MEKAWRQAEECRVKHSPKQYCQTFKFIHFLPVCLLSHCFYFIRHFTKYKNAFFFPSHTSFSSFHYFSSDHSTFCIEILLTLLLALMLGRRSLFFIFRLNGLTSDGALILLVLCYGSVKKRKVLLPFEVHLYIEGKATLIFGHCPNNPAPLMSRCRKGPIPCRLDNNRGSLTEANLLLLLFQVTFPEDLAIPWVLSGSKLSRQSTTLLDLCYGKKNNLNLQEVVSPLRPSLSNMFHLVGSYGMFFVGWRVNKNCLYGAHVWELEWDCPQCEPVDNRESSSRSLSWWQILPLVTVPIVSYHSITNPTALGLCHNGNQFSSQ